MEFGYQGQRTEAEQDFAPPVDVIAGPSAYRLLFILPGVEADHVEVEIRGRQLQVRGERRRPALEQGEKLVVEESRHGQFLRQFQLPEAVDAGRIRARYEDGILEISLPRKAPAPARKIVVAGAEDNAARAARKPG